MAKEKTTEKSKKEEKVEKEKSKVKRKKFFAPTLGKSIWARSSEEAQKIIKG